MTRALIIGYGRAGKRHGQMLDELGIEYGTVEPLPSRGNCICSWTDLDAFFETKIKDTFDFAVIATPPDLHLSQIRQCIDAGLPVLCEKPLCGLGQLAEAEVLLQHPNADKVMVAFNYRFHPKLIAPNGLPDMLVCRQQRDLPGWGLLLDHCSHDLDIMRSQTGGELQVISASHHKNSKYEWWTIDCEAQGQQIMIEEWVGPSNKRVAKLAYADHVVEIDADPVMFRDMYAAFLNGNYTPGLADAIETQRLLERCEELAN